ncbi:hypothetical protein JF50_03205 [Pseudoalteromonas luteoviolacea]|uniref:Uncharacterized protein n=1 Tax=Pseudoalteromonas luteoviolacea TaxID=43657 RepID=A0A0C1MVA1_9GAMM|nr:hypothetical protein [Pseudoalteromonas luteoviolacea]KID58868.1 hypothetical protein JF50_03205 [Pseudoalteromonas luteoviolacea]
MTDKKDVQIVDPTAHSTVVENGEPVEIQALSKLFEGVVTPIAKGQEIAATEATKRAEIQAKLIGKGLNYFFGVAFFILLIAFVALFFDKDGLAEKIILSVITFIGGLGLGKSLPKNS